MIIMIRKKRFLRAAGVLAAVVVLGAGIFTAAGVLQEKSLNTAADGNWGLSFQEAGKPPVANASMDYLKKFDAYYAEDTDKKELFLTFDAGYENGHTAKILDTLKKHNVKVVWTLHDCWAFTGHCPYFTMNKCDKWKNGCYKCDRYREYPASLFDNSKKMYKLKKKWFTGVKDLTIVTPSEWLSNLVKQSFLGGYDVRVINNGIDLAVFKPTASDFRKKHGISDDKFV